MIQNIVVFYLMSPDFSPWKNNSRSGCCIYILIGSFLAGTAACAVAANL